MTPLSFDCQHRFSQEFDLDVKFDARQRVTCLFGPSGSGKTSILSMIAGLVKPTKGAIHLGDRTVFDTSQNVDVPADRRGIGFVFQDHRLFPHMTVLANLRFGCRRSVRKHFHSKPMEFTRVVDVLELGPLLLRRPGTLSGGQRQRVSLGRALLSGPEILLMDEPLAALDDALKHRILEYLERIVEEWQIPTLMVSHSQAEVRRLSDWVVVMNDGRVVTQGSAETALGQPQMLGLKNSLGPVNLLRIDHAETLNGHVIGHVSQQPLNLLRATEEKLKAPFYVQFTPADVTLCRRDVQGVSTRNHLRGQVRQVVALSDRVFIAVDIGQILWSEVTREAASELKVVVGMDVHCLIKTNSLRIV